MHTKIIRGLMLFLAASAPVLAAPVIDVGTHYLLPNSERTIAITVSGNDEVRGLNFYIQVADGGPINNGIVTTPKITAIDIIGPGTLFHNNNTGSDPTSYPDSGATLIWSDSTSTASGVLQAAGTLAYVTIDTTGTSSADLPYALNLADVAVHYSPPGVSTDFAGVLATINPGQIVIINPHDLIWNKLDNGVWTESTWTGSPPPYPDYTARAIVDTPYKVDVNNAQEANKLTLSTGGQVAIGSTGSLAVTTDVNINAGGTLALVSGAGLTAAGINLSGGKISGSGTINPSITFAGGTLEAPGASDILTINNALGGTGDLIISGAGRVTLMGNATYNGETTIAEGLLQLQGVASHLHVINGAGGLRVGGSSPSTLTADSIVVNSVTIGPGSTITLLPIAGGPLAVGDSLLSVPEPSAAVLLLIGVMGILLANFHRFFKYF